MNLKYCLLKCYYCKSNVIKLNEPYLETSKNGIHIIVLDAIEHNLVEDINYPLDYLLQLRSKSNYLQIRFLHDIIFNIYIYLEFLHEHNIKFKRDNILAIGNVANMDNAYYNGHYFVFGEGTGCRLPLCSSAIVGHELTHSLIEQICGLEYSGLSGALNESYADIFGVLFEDYLTSKYGLGFKIGSECNYLLRDMSNPESTGQPCSTKSKRFIDPNSSSDSGAVHTNSGVINYLFYKMQLTLGLHRTFKYFLEVLYKLKENSDFNDFKKIFLNTYRSEFLIKLFDDVIG